jgi:hypothetical protein
MSQKTSDVVAGNTCKALFRGGVYPLSPWTSHVIPDGPADGPNRGRGGGGGGGEGGGSGGLRRPGMCVSVTVPRGVVPVLRARAASVVYMLSGRPWRTVVSLSGSLGGLCVL